MSDRLLTEIAVASAEHMGMVCVSALVAILIGVPAAVALTRQASTQRWAMGAVSVIQTIPSLALFGFLLPIPVIGGIGKQTAIIALILYALLPIMRNTLTGILGVDPGVRESAIAMGMTERQLLWQVDMPLAFPVILAGLRTATVATIGTATIAAAIGGGGLGTFIFRGISMVDTQTVLAGAIPAALMSVIADEVLGWFERRFSV